MVALQEHGRLEKGIKRFLSNRQPDRFQPIDFFAPDLQLVLIQSLAADVHERKVCQVDPAEFQFDQILLFGRQDRPVRCDGGLIDKIKAEQT